MLQIMSSIGVIVVMLAVILGSYGLCKKFVFYNIRINKYIPLAIAIVLFVCYYVGCEKQTVFCFLNLSGRNIYHVIDYFTNV